MRERGLKFFGGGDSRLRVTCRWLIGIGRHCRSGTKIGRMNLVAVNPVKSRPIDSINLMSMTRVRQRRYDLVVSRSAIEKRQKARPQEI